MGLLGTTRFGMGTWAMDIAAAKVAGGLMEGVVGVHPYWTEADKDLPMVKKVAEVFEKKKRKPEQFTLFYRAIWVVYAVAAEAISETVDRVGWDGLKGEAVHETLVKTQGFKCLGLQPFKFAPGKRAGWQARVMEMKNDRSVPITGWLPCPDLRPEEFK